MIQLPRAPPAVKADPNLYLLVRILEAASSVSRISLLTSGTELTSKEPGSGVTKSVQKGEVGDLLLHKPRTVNIGKFD